MKLYIIFAFLFLLPAILIAQKKQNSQPWFFVQITDPQFGMFENNNGFEKETALYEKAVSKINGLKPDFVIITGDLVNDPKNQAQIDEFKRITAHVSPEIPVYLTPGNHDVGQEPDNQSIDSYVENYGYDRFSFNHKGALFIGFNSSIIKNDLPELEQKQYKWLKKKLKGSKKENHTILFCHYPFFIQKFEEPERYSNVSPEKRNKYLALFVENNVEAVFTGHLHKNNASEFGGIHWVTTSAVGKPLSKDPSGIRIVKIYNDRIEDHYYGLDEVPEVVRF